MAAKQQQTEAKAGQWSVRDRNARGRPRTHEPVQGTTYELYAEKFTPMPQAHAVVFLGDESFDVRNSDNEDVASLPKPPDAHDLGEFRLNPGQVVANLQELSRDSLLVRAQRLPGGEQFKANAKIEDLIAFLLQEPEAQMAALREDDGTEDMSDEDAAKMLGGGDSDGGDIE